MTERHSGKFMELELESFRQMTDDSLMPWLTANQHPLKFETIIRLIDKSCASGKNYFSALIEAFAQTSVKLPPSLIAEWKMFSQIKFENKYNALKFIFKQATSRDKKYEFYYNLIAQITRYSLGSQEQIFESTASLNLRKRMINFNLKRCIGLMQRCGAIQNATAETAAITKVLLTGLRIFYIETLLHYKGFYESNLNCFGLSELMAFESYYPVSDRVNNQLMRNATELTDRFISHYSGASDTVKTSEKDKNALEVIKAKSDEMLEKFNNTDNLLMGFDYKYHNTESFSSVQENSSEASKSDIEAVSEETKADTKSLVKTSKTIRAKEVMEILGIGRTSLYNYSKNGKIPCFTIGKAYKYELDKILKLKETGFKK